MTEKSEKEPSPSGKETNNTAQNVHLWLDAIPQDVCSRIVSHIWGRAPRLPFFRDLLLLAKTSPTQRNAVLSFFKFKLNYIPYNAMDVDANTPAWYNHSDEVKLNDGRDRVLEPPDITDWEQLFFNDIQELHTSLVIFPFDRRLLSAPNLSHATIPCTKEFFLALLDAPKLTSLKVHLYDPLSPSMLCSHLGALVLTRLTLHCCYKHEKCAFTDLVMYLQGPNAIGYIFPTVTELNITCIYNHTVTATPVLRTFPALRKFTTFVKLDDLDLTVLRSLESMEFRGACVLCDEFYSPPPEQIGLPVECVSFQYRDWFGCLQEDQISALAICSNLHTFHARLGIGAEKRLLDLNSGLRCINLTWPGTTNEIFHSTLDHQYYQPSSKYLINFIRRNKGLEDVSFYEMQFSSSFLKTILRVLGSNLKGFGMGLFSNGEEPQQLLFTLMESLSTYNPALQRVGIISTELCDTSFDPEDQMYWQESLHRSMRVLKHQFPLVDFYEIEKHLGPFTGRAVPGIETYKYCPQ